jgi:hypothetical protein
MPRVGFETTIPVFEQVKIFHALNRAATVNKYMHKKKKYRKQSVNNIIEVMRFKLIQRNTNLKMF